MNGIWYIQGGGVYLGLYNNAGDPQFHVGDFVDGGGSIATGPSFTSAGIAVGSDFVFRVTKNVAAALLTAEIWSVNGSHYLATSVPMPTPSLSVAGVLQIGDNGSGASYSSGPTGAIAFIRWFSTILPLASKAPFGSAAGDLGDWEFSNNLTDSSTHGDNLSTTGGISYSTAPAYAPACILPPQTSFRAGSPVTTLTAANSFPLNGTNVIAGYTWQQINEVSPLAGIAGPSNLVFSNRASVSPIISGSIAGSYTLQLTVTDSSGQSSTCNQKYGFVATDANGSVIISNPVHAKIIGPMLAAQKNPWPAFEAQGTAYANLMIQKLAGTNTQFPTSGGAYEFIDYWNTAQAGTVSVSTSSPVVTGTGTAFKSLFCGGGTTPVPVNGTQPFIVIWYPIGASAVYPAGTLPAGTTGRRLYSVHDCVDDTHLNICNPGNCSTPVNYDTYGDPITLGGTGLSYAYCDNGTGNNFGGIGDWLAGNIPGNYYDNVKALYAQYYRTGIDDYLYWGQILADRWWSYPGVDKGVVFDGTNGNYALQYRAMSITGLFLRAADTINPTPYSYFPGLGVIANYLIGTNSGLGPTDCRKVGPVAPYNQNSTVVPFCLSDIREQSYASMYVAFDALFDPNPTQAAASLRALDLDIQNRWALTQQPAGNWVMWDTTGFASWVNGFTVTATTGLSTITAQAGNDFSGGYANGSLTVGPYNSGNPPGAIWFTSTGTNQPYSDSQGEAAWYYACYSSSTPTQIRLCDINGNSVNYMGAGGSGLGWEVSGLLAGGTQPFMVGIQNQMFYFASLALATADPIYAAKLSGFALSNANWMATTGFNSTTKGLYYGRVFLSCEPPSAQDPFCDSGPFGDRELNGEGINVATYAYLLNPGSRVVKTLGDTMMDALWSWNVGDPGYDGLSPVSDMIAPTGYFYSGTGQHKWFGYYWGIGGNWAWASARLGGLMPPIRRVVQVSLDFQSATQALLIVTSPDGTTSQVTCTSSPCPVTIDAREGDHLLSISYMNPANRVLQAAKIIVQAQ